MLLNISAGPVPGPCARRRMVPSSMFQSTSASISRNSPAALSAAIQPLRSPNATGFRSTVILSLMPLGPLHCIGPRQTQGAGLNPRPRHRRHLAPLAGRGRITSKAQRSDGNRVRGRFRESEPVGTAPSPDLLRYVRAPLASRPLPASGARWSKRHAISMRASAEPLGGRGDFGDEVAHELLVRQRRQRHLARLQPRCAGIYGAPVELDHAFLAGIGVDAGEADRQRRVTMHAKPAHAIEHRLAGLERDFERLPASGLAVEPAPDPQPGDVIHGTATVAPFLADQARSLPRRRTTWFTSHASSMPEKSSR